MYPLKEFFIYTTAFNQIVTTPIVFYKNNVILGEVKINNYMIRRHYNCLLKQIREQRPFYYKCYCFSIILTYLFIVFFATYLTNSAYDNFLFKKNSQNVLYSSCVGCVLMKYFLYINLFNIIFYTINEIRFRIIQFKSVRKVSLKSANVITISIAILLFLLSISVVSYV